jgi:hypothetical protein
MEELLEAVFSVRSLEAPKRESSAWGYNWATLFLGNINTAT